MATTGSARFLRLATGFMEASVQDALADLFAAARLNRNKYHSISTFVAENEIDLDAFRRLLYAAKTLGLVDLPSADTFVIPPEPPRYSARGSQILFWIVRSGLDARLSSQESRTSPPSALRLVNEGFDSNSIDDAVKFDILEARGAGSDEIAISPDFASLLSPSSPYYMGLWIRNYDKIASRIFSREGLLGAVKTGRPQWAETFGKDITNPFDLSKLDPAMFSDWMEGMHQSNVAENETIARKLAFAPGETTVLDLGGASGAWAMALVDTHPTLQNVTIYELASAITLYRKMFRRYSAGRPYPIDYVAGDFLSTPEIPKLTGLPGDKMFDIVTLGWILHDWCDALTVKILKKARGHLAATGRLVVLEAILPEDRLGRATLLDLTMLVQTGGRERTLKDFERIARMANLEIRRVYETQGRRQILELEPT